MSECSFDHTTSRPHTTKSPARRVRPVNRILSPGGSSSRWGRLLNPRRPRIDQSSREICWSAFLADFRRSGLTHFQFYQA